MGNSSASWPSPPEHRRSQGCSPHFHGSKRVRVAALLQTGKRSLCFRRSKWRRPLWYFRLCACASSVLAYCKSLMKDFSHFGCTTLMRFMRCRPTEAYECCCCEVSSSWGLWGYEVPPSWGLRGTSLMGHQPWEMTPRETNAHLIQNLLLWSLPLYSPILCISRSQLLWPSPPIPLHTQKPVPTEGTLCGQQFPAVQYSLCWIR